MSKRILVIGPSGSGKTYVSTMLHEKGINAVDADLLEGLSDWFDSDGEKVECPPDAGKEFLDTHRFLWSKEFLVKFLQDQTEIYLFGMAGNVFDMINLFDRVYFLKTQPKILAERLRRKSRENPMGKTEYQLKNALQYAKEIEGPAHKLGITMIDAEQTPESIFQQLNV